MNAEQITKLFEPWRAKHVRTAWKPVVERSEAADSLSWFGGQPTGSPDDPWPVCEQCQAPMRFLLQLAFAELPQQANLPFRDGILQLFYCSSDDGSCETWAPFSGTDVFRVLPHASGVAAGPPGIDPLPQVHVIRWEAMEDHPHPEEHRALGLSYEYDFKRSRVSVQGEDPAIRLDDLDIDLNVAETISLSRPGDKLGGWPYWIQGAEYPQCPDCATPMELLLQVDSEDNLDYMFGDAGCAHVTYCPQHPNVFAFGWACG